MPSNEKELSEIDVAHLPSAPKVRPGSERAFVLREISEGIGFPDLGLINPWRWVETA